MPIHTPEISDDMLLQMVNNYIRICCQADRAIFFEELKENASQCVSSLFDQIIVPKQFGGDL